MKLTYLYFGSLRGSYSTVSTVSKTNPWALTSFLKENATVFGSIEA